MQAWPGQAEGWYQKCTVTEFLLQPCCYEDDIFSLQQRMIPVVLSLPLRDSALDGPASASALGPDLIGNTLELSVTDMMESNGFSMLYPARGWLSLLPEKVSGLPLMCLVLLACCF